MDRISLDSALDRRLLPPAGGRRFLCLTLRAPQSPTQEPAARKPLNLSFVLDRSGSMEGEKLELVKRAVAFGLNQLAPDDRAAVVTYDDRVQTLAPSARMTGDAKTQVSLALRRVRSGGSTALGEGWLTGCRLAATTGAELGGRWLTRTLLLTDGLANVGITDPHELIGHATELRRRGVTTTTFGVGADFDEQLLRGMAEAGGGNFYFIDRADQIPAFFAGELGELLTVVAEGASLTLTMPSGMGALLLNDYPVSRSGGEWPALYDGDGAGETLTVEIGSLSAGEDRVLVFELTGAPGAVGTEARLGIGLRYRRSIDGGEERITASPTTLRYVATADAEAEQPDLAVIEAAGHLQAARAKFEAWEHTRAGRHAEARATLSGTARGFAAGAMAPAAPALAQDIAELNSLAEQSATGGWDSATSKRTLYTSQIVSKSRRDYGKKP
jgi:Ca-activated chloride channel family protein